MSLHQSSSFLSESSSSSNRTIGASPTSPTVHRPGYRRIPSAVDEGALSPAIDIFRQSSDETHSVETGGLNSHKGQMITRGGVGSKCSQETLGLTDPLVSPVSVESRDGTDMDAHCPDKKDEQDCLNGASAVQHQRFPADYNLASLQSRFGDSHFTCRSKGPLATGRCSFATATVLILSLYSSALSALWLIIAFAEPRYGRVIAVVGKLSPQTASVVFAAFAKTIELSFATVIVTFLGQVLSKRAIGDRKCITIADMSMRSWVLQPGTLITRLPSVRFAAFTPLGIFALLATMISMVYTTASDALVTPKLKLGKAEDRMLHGKVSTMFANHRSIEDRCNTPIQRSADPDNYGATCVQIEHSGEAYHNYMQYLGAWRDNIGSANVSVESPKRSDPVGILYDNTTVRGSWLNVTSMAELSSQHRRIVNNVTMAMPHPGVIAAVADPINSIVQPTPNDTSGLGEYWVNASVPSPVVNVLCAQLTNDELKPMIYPEWPNEYRNKTVPDSTNWPNDFDLRLPSPLIPTAVDDLFGFDENQPHPIFPKRPEPFNTVLNDTSAYGPHSIYVLATTERSAYTLCSLRVALTPDCSTGYHATLSGGNLDVHCEDPNDRLAYGRSHPEAMNGMWSPDWISIGSEWAKALSLNDGISNGKSTNARLLSQLIPTTPSLDPKLPSISEALAVLAGNTLLLSAIDSPFIHYWNYSATMFSLEEPQYQGFNASFRNMDYQSGGTKPWDKSFFVVLLLLCAANCFCLLYFIISGELMTDFIDPHNLFCLSLLSPPCQALEGACGGGPSDQQLRTKFNINRGPSRDHLCIEESEISMSAMGNHRRTGSVYRKDVECEGGKNSVSRAYSRIRKNRMSRI